MLHFLNNAAGFLLWLLASVTLACFAGHSNTTLRHPKRAVWAFAALLAVGAFVWIIAPLLTPDSDAAHLLRSAR